MHPRSTSVLLRSIPCICGASHVSPEHLDYPPACVPAAPPASVDPLDRLLPPTLTATAALRRDANTSRGDVSRTSKFRHCTARKLPAAVRRDSGAATGSTLRRR